MNVSMEKMIHEMAWPSHHKYSRPRRAHQDVCDIACPYLYPPPSVHDWQHACRTAAPLRYNRRKHKEKLQHVMVAHRKPEAVAITRHGVCALNLHRTNRREMTRLQNPLCFAPFPGLVRCLGSADHEKSAALRASGKPFLLFTKFNSKKKNLSPHEVKMG